MNENSGSRKRKSGTPTSSIVKKRFAFEVLTGVPSEIWAQILSFLDIRDWSRLEPVAKQFRTLILQHCWTTLQNLTLDTQHFCKFRKQTHAHDSIEICCDSYPKFELSAVRAQKLLTAIAQKSPKLISLKLPYYSFCCELQKQPLTKLGLLPGLSCCTLKQFQISTFITNLGYVQEVAKLLHRTKETLTQLDLALYNTSIPQNEFNTEVTQILRRVSKSLINLESLTISYDHSYTSRTPKYNEYLLMDKPKLAYVKIDFSSFNQRHDNYFTSPAKALLDSKATLDWLYLNSESYGQFLTEYEKELGARPKQEEHPLSSLRRFDAVRHLNLSFDGPQLLRLCPNLEVICAHGSSRIDRFKEKELSSLIKFMASFLNDVGVENEGKVLQLNFPYSAGTFPTGHLEALTGSLVKTMESLETKCPWRLDLFDTFPVKIFRKGTVSIRLLFAFH